MHTHYIPNVHVHVHIVQLALKHRQNKNQKMRIVVFIGSPMEAEEKEVGVTIIQLVYKSDWCSISPSWLMSSLATNWLTDEWSLVFLNNTHHATTSPCNELVIIGMGLGHYHILLDIIGLDIMGLDIMGLDILGRTPCNTSPQNVAEVIITHTYMYWELNYL